MWSFIFLSVVFKAKDILMSLDAILLAVQVGGGGGKTKGGKSHIERAVTLTLVT